LERVKRDLAKKRRGKGKGERGKIKKGERDRSPKFERKERVRNEQ